MIKLTDIYAEIQVEIKNNDLDLTTQIGSVASDIFIVPLAQKVLEELIRQEYTRGYSSLDRLIELKTDEDFLVQIEELGLTTTELNQQIALIIDKLATNWSLTRIAAIGSTGTVYFSTTVIPGSDIIIPLGTSISTVAGKEYETTEETIILAATINDFYDPVLNAYTIATPIAAKTPGVIGNTGADTIVVLDDIIIGISQITNKTALINGADIESDEAFVNRIKTKLAGNNVGTPNGYSTLISSQEFVDDSIVVTPNNEEMKRNSYGGSIDIMIVGEKELVVQDLVNYVTAQHGIEIILDDKPALEIDSVTATTPGVITDYTFVKDTGILGGSVQSKDKIVWGATKPTDGDLVTINYKQNELIKDLQDLVDLDENKIIAVDVLVREATKIETDIEFTLHIFSGYDFAEISNLVETRITNYINALLLDQDVQIADLINVIYEVSGVDNVTNFLINGNPTDLIINKTEYARLNTVVIN